MIELEKKFPSVEMLERDSRGIGDRYSRIILHAVISRGDLQKTA
jgi:hypothetical protein